MGDNSAHHRLFSAKGAILIHSRAWLTASPRSTFAHSRQIRRLNYAYRALRPDFLTDISEI